MFGQLLAAPTDVLKVRLQAQRQQRGATTANGKKNARSSSRDYHYKGMLDAFRHIWRQEGVSAFFKGLTPSLGRAACMYGSSIATYDTAKGAFAKLCTSSAVLSAKADGAETEDDNMIVHVLSSLCSGFVAAVISTPFDVIKTRLIDQRGHLGSTTLR